MGKNGHWNCSICNYRNFASRPGCRTDGCAGARPWWCKGHDSSSNGNGSGRSNEKEIQALKEEVRKLKEEGKKAAAPGGNSAGTGEKSPQEQRDKLRSELQTLAGLTGVEEVIARKKAEEAALVAKIQAEKKPHIQLKELEERLARTKKSIGTLRDATIPDLEKKLASAKAELIEKEADVVRMESQREGLFRGSGAAGGIRADATKAMDNIKQLQGLLTGPAGEKYTLLLGELLAEVERNVAQGTDAVKQEEPAQHFAFGTATAGSQQSQPPQDDLADMELDETDQEEWEKMLDDYARVPASDSAGGPSASDKRKAMQDFMREAYGRAAKKSRTPSSG